MNHKHSQSRSHVSLDVNLMVYNSVQKWINDKCQCECKTSREKDYAWNPSTWTCECGEDCEIGECLKYRECMKSLIDDLVVAGDETVDTPETALISLSNGINYWVYCCGNNVLTIVAVHGS